MPVISCWRGKVHDVIGISGDPRILISDGLTPCIVELSSVVRRWVPGNFVLVISVRPSGVFYGP